MCSAKIINWNLVYLNSKSRYFAVTSGQKQKPFSYNLIFFKISEEKLYNKYDNQLMFCLFNIFDKNVKNKLAKYLILKSNVLGLVLFSSW